MGFYWCRSNVFRRTSYGTNVSSDGDAIGRIKNKATGTTALGTFLRATSDSERPLYKTGGQNSKTFARFDGSNDHLFGKRHTNQDWGAVNGSTFSTSTVYQNAVSVIFVGKTTNAAASGNEKLFNLNGPGSVTATMTIQKTGYGADDLQGFMFDANSSNTSTFYNDSDFGTSVALYSVVFATGTSTIDGVNAGNCISYKNGVIDQDARGTATSNEGMVFNTGNMSGFAWQKMYITLMARWDLIGEEIFMKC